MASIDTAHAGILDHPSYLTELVTPLTPAQAAAVPQLHVQTRTALLRKAATLVTGLDEAISVFYRADNREAYLAKLAELTGPEAILGPLVADPDCGLYQDRNRFGTVEVHCVGCDRVIAPDLDFIHALTCPVRRCRAWLQAHAPAGSDWFPGNTHGGKF